MKPKMITLFASLAIASTAHAFDGSPEQQVNAFFESYAEKGPEAAVNGLYDNNALVAAKQQQLSMLAVQMTNASTLFGRYLGAEQVHLDEMTPSLQRLVYVAKYEAHPLVWEFYFYKPENKWIASQSTFNDNFSKLDSKR